METNVPPPHHKPPAPPPLPPLVPPPQYHHVVAASHLNTVIPASTSPDHDPRYMCCYGSCWHVRTCALLIGAYEFFMVTISIVTLAILANEKNHYVDLASVPTIILMVTIAFTIITVIFMFLGIMYGRHFLLVPYLVWQMVQIAIIVILLVIALIASWSSMLMFANLVAPVMMKIFFTVQVKGCYEYLRAKRGYQEMIRQQIPLN